MVWLGILGASLATKSGTADPGHLIVDNFGVLAIPVLFLVLHGPIATNILNIYTFSVAAQALDIKAKRRFLNLFVGILALVGVVVLHPAVGLRLNPEHLARRARGVGRRVGRHHAGALLLGGKHSPWQWTGSSTLWGTRRLPAFNWAGITALLVGIFATWLFMYGVSADPCRAPSPAAMGGI